MKHPAPRRSRLEKAGAPSLWMLEPLESRISPAVVASSAGGGLVYVSLGSASDQAVLSGGGFGSRTIEISGTGLNTVQFTNVVDIFVTFADDNQTVVTEGLSGTPYSVFMEAAKGITNPVVQDDSGLTTLNFSQWFAKGTFTNFGAIPDGVTAIKNGNFVLTDSELTNTDGMQLALTNVRTAHLVDLNGGNSFDVSGWTGNGVLTNDGSFSDPVTATKAAGFNLSDTALTSTDGMNLTLIQSMGGIHNATLTDTAGGNTFTVDGWTGTAALKNTASSPDSLSATKAGGFSLTNTSLTDTADAMNISFAAGAIQTANLTDSTGGHTFNFGSAANGWGHTANLAVTSGMDSITVAKAGGYSLSNTELTDTADAMDLKFAAGSIQTANLTDTTGGHNFDFGAASGGWSYTANLTVSTGIDSLSAAKSGGFLLTNTQLTDTTDAMLVKYASGAIQTANLTDAGGGNNFLVSQWTHGGTLSNSGTLPDSVTATKAGGFTLHETSLSDTADSMSLTLTQTGGGIFTANLTDSLGGQTFDLGGSGNSWTHTATLADAGTADTVTVAKAGGFVLTDTSLTDSADGMSVTFASGAVQLVKLTDTAGGNDFQTSQWNYAATLTNTGATTDSVTAAKAGGFTLTSTLLTDSADAMSLTLVQTGSGIQTANLTDSAGGNVFQVSSWLYAGTLANTGASADSVTAAKAGGFTLKEASLSDTADAMNLTLAQSGGGIHTANLTDTLGGNTFNFGGDTDGWTHLANLVDDGAADTIVAAKAGGFTLTDTELTGSADSMDIKYSAGSIQTANLTDTAGGKTFTVDGWTGGGTLTNLGASVDTAAASKVGGFTLSDASLTDGADAMHLTLAQSGGGIQANLTDTVGGNTFAVTGWTHGGKLSSLGAADTVNYTDTITQDDTPVIVHGKTKGKVTTTTFSIGVVLTNDLLYSTNGMSLGLTNIGTAELTAGTGANEVLDASHFTGTLDMTGSAGAENDTLIAGLGINQLFGGLGADRFVLTGFSVSDSLTPSFDAAHGVTNQRDLIDYSARLFPTGHSAFNKAGVTVNLGLIGTAQAVNAKSTNPALKTEGMLTLNGLFDDLEGSKYNDKLTGDDLTNILYGGGGADRLAGGGVPARTPNHPANHDFLFGNGQTVFAPPARGSGEIDTRFRSGVSPFPKTEPIIVPEAILAAVTASMPDPFIESLNT